MIPPWAIEAAAALAKGALDIITAPDETARIDAAMTAAERLKAALDKQKFGG